LVGTWTDRTLAVTADPSRLAANTATGDSLGQTKRAAGDGPIVGDHDSCFFGYMQGEPGLLRRAPLVGSFFWLAPSWRKGTEGPSLVWGWKMLVCIITFLQVVRRCRVPTGKTAITRLPRNRIGEGERGTGEIRCDECRATKTHVPI
jgi:hypothetical protein